MSNQPETLTLPRPQIREITGFHQVEKQKEALRAMGIDFYERPNGQPVVLKSALERHATATKESSPQPNLAAIDK